jgi:cbb3-type cytochrome oxidase subunit 3
MGGIELLAVIVFFLIGYWIVDYFWPGKKQEKDGPERKP